MSSNNTLTGLTALLARASDLEFVAASHEDPERPGALKKILFSAADLPSGKLQMVNLAKIPAGKGFQQHYHEDMHEVFLITSGKAQMSVGSEIYVIERGDAVLVPPGAIHSMTALAGQDVDYLVFGVSEGKNGKTVVIKK